MQKLLTIGLILIFSLNQSWAQGKSDYEKLCQDISELIVTNNKTEFLKRFSPTKEDLLELSYGTKADKVGEGEREGFFNTVQPTIIMLNNNISTSFDFVYGKYDKNKMAKINTVELIKITKSNFVETELDNLHFIISDGENQFKVALLGVYRTSRDWIIMTDIAPGYF